MTPTRTSGADHLVRGTERMLTNSSQHHLTRTQAARGLDVAK
jgi:hypothetical protein